VDGSEALNLGLVTRVADDPRAAAMELAAEIAQRSPDAVAAAKHLFNDAWRAGFADGLALEARAQLGLLGRPNQMEAVQANFGNRPARFAPIEKAKNGG
jgi:enoyl-CoA hydratase/carnithine racemase